MSSDVEKGGEGGEDDCKKRLDGLHKKLEIKREARDFLIDPSGWLSTHVKDWTFEKDDDYIKCVCQILEKAEDSKKDVCPHILIAAALVTEDKLIELKDPMTSAIKLEFEIKELEKQNDDLYRQHYKNLLKVLSEFAVSLLDECLSPKEVMQLMRIEDKAVLKKIHLAKNKDIVARPFYNSLYTEIVFWHESDVGLSSPFSWHGLRRIIILIVWNVLYLPVEVIRLLCKDCSARITKQYDFHKWLFSPVSCYFADLVNYVVLVLLMFAVVLQSNIGSRQKAARDLVNKYNAGEIQIDEDERFIYNSEGIVAVQLEKSPIKPPEWALLACIVSRFLCELYQLVNQQLVSRTASSNGDNNEISCWSFLSNKLKQYWKSDMHRKLKQYWKSDMNKIDCALMVCLLVAFGTKLHYVFYQSKVYGRVCAAVDDGCEGDGIDYSLEARRIVYMVHLYSVAGLLTLVRMFYSIFLFVPVIGHILRSIQMMLRDVGKVVVILLFFSAGFFIPLYAIVQCYRTIYTDPEEKKTVPTKEDDEETFKTMKSPSIGVFTMLLSMLEGKLTYADDVYSSKDTSTSIFLSIILVIYYILFGLLCLNLLIGLITKRYETMMETKYEDWRFAQFDFLMDYNATEPEYGMPFYFPFCIIYITWCLCRMIVEKCLPIFVPEKNDVYEKLIPTLLIPKLLPDKPLSDDTLGSTFAKMLLKRRKKKEEDSESKTQPTWTRCSDCKKKHALLGSPASEP